MSPNDPFENLRLDESEILRVLIRAAAVPCEVELLTQVKDAKVSERSGTWLRLAVSELAPRAACPDGPLPIRGLVVDESGRTTGFLLLWLRGGLLASLEHAWVTDDVPTSLPGPDQITAVRPQGWRS